MASNLMKLKQQQHKNLLIIATAMQHIFHSENGLTHKHNENQTIFSNMSMIEK